MKKYLTLSLIFLTIPFIIFGQISIESGDMPSPGDTFRVSWANPIVFDPSATGTNYLWNFSILESNNQSVDTFISLIEVPPAFLFLIFGKANLAQIASPPIPGGIGDSLPTSPGYNFFMNSSSQFSMTGQGFVIQDIPIPVLFDGPDVLYRFPLTYGNRDTSFSKRALILPTIGGIYSDVWRFNEVDGEGTIITPLDTFQALRMRSEIHRKDSLSISGVNQVVSSESVEYKWLAKGEGIPVLQINTQIISGTEIPVSFAFKDKYSKGEPNSVSERIRPGASVKLYPTPIQAGKQLHIRAEGGTRSLDVHLYDSNGRLILSRSFQNDAADISLPDNLSTGIYFIKVREDKETFTKKLMIFHR